MERLKRRIYQLEQEVARHTLNKTLHPGEACGSLALEDLLPGLVDMERRRLSGNGSQHTTDQAEPDQNRL